MASFDELARRHTALSPSALGHLRRLVGSWGLLSDFCFADLLLFVPVEGDAGSRFFVLGQMRPTTNQTLYREDMVGTVVDEDDRPLVARCWRLEQIVEGGIVTQAGEEVREQSIPVRWNGRTVAVLTRDSATSVERRTGELEGRYLGIFDKFAQMIVEGEFPFATEDTAPVPIVPRVGDGVMVLDDAARVEYASPNAVSALHRFGIFANLVGTRLGDVGFDESPIRSAFAFSVPVAEEIDTADEVSVVVRCIPLLRDGRIDSAVVLIRDISDLRRRDRLLLSKDAAIRETHHRVKNNLQTISSLLRLQARRLESSEAREAIEESVRRIRSIALVHETLSRASGDDVAFDDIVRPLVRMVEEGLMSEDRPVHVDVQGEAGELSTQVATPLAVVLTELLQNAVEHAFPADPVEAGHVLIDLKNDGTEIFVRVHDNGVGLPDGFSIETSGNLGLTIVKALVESELRGSISMRTDNGTLVELRLPVRPTLPIDR